jgi:hypothetical protein
LEPANSASAAATNNTKVQNRKAIASPQSSSAYDGSRAKGNCRILVRAGGLVEAVAQLLAGLEERDVLFGNLDAVARARVAADPGVAALHRKRAEAAQLDPVAACQGRGDLVENGGHDRFDIALVKVRVGFRESLNEL